MFWCTGPQIGMPTTKLGDWTQCYVGNYGESSLPSTDLTTILTACNRTKLMMGCRPMGASSLQLAAMGSRSDVLNPSCGDQQNCTNEGNGVGWYFSNDQSWGFAPAGQSVSRNSCDTNGFGDASGPFRMCWHTYANNSLQTGYRCGNDMDYGGAYQREVWQMGDIACPAGQTLCTGVCVDEQTDVNNCGSCGNVCPMGQVCSAGSCVVE
jgi:hypothetical protein